MFDKCNGFCDDKILGEQMKDNIWLLSTIIDSSPDIDIFALDKEYNYLFFNEKHKNAIKSIWGKHIEVGMNMLKVINEDKDRKSAKLSFDKALSGESFNTIEQYYNKNLADVYWKNYFAPIRSKKGEVIGVTSFVLDITDRMNSEKEREKVLKEKDILLRELEEKNEMLKTLSETDALTGLKNKKYILDKIDMEIAKAVRYDYIFSIIIIDVDNFKKVNDTYGHLTGDEILKEIGNKMKNSLRKVDELGRFGGEEFIILLPHISKEDAIKVAEKIRKNIAELKWNFKTKVTISTGVAEYKKESMEDLINRADKNLYKAKKNGRNRTEG
jgi:diguanylate cyclase (GGDEF)-like protein/PAS domain S-box-containing protein